MFDLALIQFYAFVLTILASGLCASSALTVALTIWWEDKAHMQGEMHLLFWSTIVAFLGYIALMALTSLTPNFLTKLGFYTLVYLVVMPNLLLHLCMQAKMFKKHFG